MTIKIQLSDQMADRGISLNDLSAEVGITNVNLSRIKTGKVKAVRFRTLDSLCTALGCQPGDILYHVIEDSPDTDR